MAFKLVGERPVERQQNEWEYYSGQYDVRYQQKKVKRPHQPLTSVASFGRGEMVQNIRNQEERRAYHGGIDGSPVIFNLFVFDKIEGKQQNHGSQSIQRGMNRRQETEINAEVYLVAAHRAHE